MEDLGFKVEVERIENAPPFLFAERIEQEGLPTVLGYGHGDVVSGMDEAWQQGLSPWTMTETADRLYGRGTAYNKGQHTINLAALKAVLETRGRLGFNAKYLIEMGDERGSPGLRDICARERVDVLQRQRSCNAGERSGLARQRGGMENAIAPDLCGRIPDLPAVGRPGEVLDLAPGAGQGQRRRLAQLAADADPEA